jgi:cell wall-associated NlpC family hydrolase
MLTSLVLTFSLLLPGTGTAVSVDPKAVEIIQAALEQVGTPYRYATADPDKGFDCSGLVYYAASQAGIELPHSSRAQINAAEPVSEPLPGDLIWYPGHVAIYLGNGLQVHAPEPGKTVEVRKIPDRDDLRFGRIVPTKQSLPRKASKSLQADVAA